MARPGLQRVAERRERGGAVGEHRVLRERRRGPRRTRARARRCWPGATTSVSSPIAVRLLGLEDAAGEDDVERAALADDARQALRAAVDERDAPAALGEAEPRVRVADAQVAPQRQLEPAGEAPAADRGDRRASGSSGG